MAVAHISILLLVICACIINVNALRGTTTSAAPAAQTQQPPSSCFELRLKERNMDQLYEAINRASGLGEGAGEYMTPSAVRTLTGRSRNDIRRLKSFAEGLGGRLRDVSELRDSVTLCLGAKASQRLLLAHPTPAVARHRLLLHDPAAPNLDEPSQLAAALAQALPPKYADMLHFVAPHVPPPGHPAHQRKLQEAAASGHQDYQDFQQQRTTKAWPFENTNLVLPANHSYVAIPLTVAPIPGPSSVGPNVTLSYGSKSLGTLYADGYQLAMPLFQHSSPLVYLGMYTVEEQMNNHQTLAYSFMMPCEWVTEENGTATFIRFATAADVANGTCSATFSSNYTASFAAFHGPDVNGTISQSSADMFSVSCGDAIARSMAAGSAGVLPGDLCASIRSQVNVAVANDIGNDTLIFVYNTTTAGLPSLTPLSYMSRTAVFQGSGTSKPVVFNMGTWFSGIVTSIGPTNTPAYLRELYGAAPLNNGASKGLLAAVSGVYSFPYDYSPVDLALANEALGAAVPNVTELLDAYGAFAPNDARRVYGPKNNDTWQGEAALDVQVLTQFGEGSGISYGFGASNVSYPGNLSVYIGVAPATFTLRPVPDIISWSYGSTFPYLKASFIYTLGEITYEAVSNAIFAKYAAMGITVLVSSGDSGYSGNRFPATCEQAFLSPSFPATSPFVTAVGAVMQSYTRPPSSSADLPELVTCMSGAGGLVTSGGGFGSYTTFANPELFRWQQDVVAQYIDAHQNSSVWPNTTELLLSGGDYCTEIGCSYGRGYPDLSLIGSPVPVVDSGVVGGFAGTSVTTPTMAGLVAQINSAIRAVPGLGNSRIGFMNPFLYWAAAKYPGAFTDITVGGNNFPGVYSPLECPGGYPAAPGWDAATGLGMPNITVLQRAAIEYVITQQKMARRHRRHAA